MLRCSFGLLIWWKWEVGGESVVWGTLLVVKTKVASISNQKTIKKYTINPTTMPECIVWAVDMVE